MWALVVLQGAMLVLASIESLVMNAISGFALVGVLGLTVGSATLALRTARGLRERRRWARRVTLIAEWGVLTLGSIEVVATMALAGTPPGLVPVITGIVMPVSVLVLLRKTKSLFVGSSAASAQRTENASIPTDDPVLGTLV